MKTLTVFIIATLLLFTIPAFGQDETIVGKFEFSSKFWCKDDTTFCWNDNNRFLSGLRLLYEPLNASLIFDQAGDNKIAQGDFPKLQKLGLEINLYENWLSFQYIFIAETEVELDGQSPARDKITTSDGMVTIDRGFAYGISLIDGAVAIGVGKLTYEKRDFSDNETIETDFTYVTFQLISVVKLAKKSLL